MPQDFIILVMSAIATIFSLTFIYLFWERVCVSRGGAERERERIENPTQALHCQWRAPNEVQSHKLWDYDLSLNQESNAQPTATQASLIPYFLNDVLKHLFIFCLRRALMTCSDGGGGPTSLPHGATPPPPSSPVYFQHHPWLDLVFVVMWPCKSQLNHITLCVCTTNSFCWN